MNITNVTEFFYSKASKRVRVKVLESGLTYSKIYKPDHKQISRIINNKRSKNNPFLICDAVLENFYQDETTNTYIECGLLINLDFSSKTEILWGNEKEIKGYLFELFVLLWNEVTECNNKYEIDRELYLCDYIPYAKYSTYWNILFSKKNTYPAVYYGIMEDDIINNIDESEENAYLFLYNKCSDEFQRLFFEFAKNTISFHKINTVFLKEFIEERFIPMLVYFKPNSDSLGLRVKNLIQSDLSHVAPLIFGKKNIDHEYYSKLINASSTYIVSLENLKK